MNRNIFATLSEAIEEIEGNNYNHNQDLVLLHPSPRPPPPPTTNHPYTSDEGVGDDGIGLAGNLDLQLMLLGKLNYINMILKMRLNNKSRKKRKVTKEEGKRT